MKATRLKGLDSEIRKGIENGLLYYITIDMDLSEKIDSSKLNPYVEKENQPVYADLNDITTVRGGN